MWEGVRGRAQPRLSKGRPYHPSLKLCGAVNVNAKKIVVAVTVVRLVLEVLVTAGVGSGKLLRKRGRAQRLPRNAKGGQSANAMGDPLHS